MSGTIWPINNPYSPSTLNPQFLYLLHFHPLRPSAATLNSLDPSLSCTPGLASGGGRRRGGPEAVGGRTAAGCGRPASGARRARDGPVSGGGTRRMGRPACAGWGKRKLGRPGERRQHAQAAAGERRRRVQAAAGEPWRRRAGWAGGLACRWVRWAGLTRSSDLRVVPGPLARPMNQHDTVNLSCLSGLCLKRVSVVLG